MTTTSLENRRWSRTRWWAFVAAVFGVQVCVIFGLSDRTQIRPRRAVFAPALRFAGPGWSEALALMNPAMFSLPNRHGFSGPAWMELAQAPTRQFNWTEEPRWLTLDAGQLGQAFGQFLRSNAIAPYAVSTFPDPALTLPEQSRMKLPQERSTIRIEGPLAQRRFLNPPVLPDQPYPELLTNTVVQLVVDADGRTVSATILAPIPGVSPEADRLALETAQGAEFEPAHQAGPASERPPTRELTWGKMIFQWHTVPVAPTNAPTIEP